MIAVIAAVTSTILLMLVVALSYCEKLEHRGRHKSQKTLKLSGQCILELSNTVPSPPELFSSLQSGIRLGKNDFANNHSTGQASF